MIPGGALSVGSTAVLDAEPAATTIRVAVVSPIVVTARGLTAMLERFPERVEVVPGEAGGPAAAVVVYDVMGLLDDETELMDLVGRADTLVLALAQDLRPELAARALAIGARAAVPSRVDAEALTRAVESMDDVPPRREPARPRPALGRDARLTKREVDVLMRITWNYSNREIAADLGLSGNSVKTYIRSAYRRIAVTSRTRAVVWCLHHGFPTEPDPASRN